MTQVCQQHIAVWTTVRAATAASEGHTAPSFRPAVCSTRSARGLHDRLVEQLGLRQRLFQLGQLLAREGGRQLEGDAGRQRRHLRKQGRALVRPSRVSPRRRGFGGARTCCRSCSTVCVTFAFTTCARHGGACR